MPLSVELMIRFPPADCGTVVNADTVQAQVQSAVIFGITAALHGHITLKNGRVEQTTFHDYQMPRMNEAPAVEVHVIISCARFHTAAAQIP